MVGLPLADLERWDAAIGAQTGRRLASRLALSDLVALAVLRAVARRLGERAEGFTLGLGRLFQVLGARPDVERLDDFAALVGPDFARLAEVDSGHVQCVGDAFIVVPLRPILAHFRDQAFS